MPRNHLPFVLGISASHNGAACLLHGDQIVVAVQEERLVRIKRQRIFGAGPSLSILYCLRAAGIGPEDLSAIALCVQGSQRDPVHDLARNPILHPGVHRTPCFFVPHHRGHAVSAFATSGFDQAAVLVVDGKGSPFSDLPPDEQAVAPGRVANDCETISLYAATGTSVHPLAKQFTKGSAWLTARGREMPLFDSLGGMYSAVAKQIFGNPMEAGKVMGLAPYGQPTIPVESFLDVSGLEVVFRDSVPRRFTRHDRWPECEEEYRDLAASAQAALEASLLHLCSRLRGCCPSENLCFAGGVALNSVANERLVRESGFRNVYVVPAAEDSGVAIGAAYHALWELTGHNTRRRLIHDAPGRTYGPAEIDAAVAYVPEARVLPTQSLVSDVADLLCDGKIVGWFQQGSELGPRALGQRSILCDPRRAEMKNVLNLKVKNREAFRPFAPAVLGEEASRWFDFGSTGCESPFMLRVCEFTPACRDTVPAVVHVDGTGRLQTLTPAANGPFYDLVRAFHERTGVPILLNTSFNVAGEPIVETPYDALACLMNTEMDYCVLEDRIVGKPESQGGHAASAERAVRAGQPPPGWHVPV